MAAALPHRELDPPMPDARRRTERNDRPRLLVAVGGNALHPGRGPGTVEEQREYAARTGRSLLPIMRADNELVITHGNGPVIGKILMRQVLSRERVPPMSMDVCVAHSQGGIAYLLMQSLENTLREAGDDRHVVCLLTQVEVDPDDPAFGHPTKPIGFFYEEAEARAVGKNLGWTMRDDAGRVLVVGDYNTAHRESDLARPKANVRNSGFLPEGRAEFDRWLEAGWVDTFRALHPDEPDHYSWWAQRGGARARNVGWRIDYARASPEAMERVRGAFIWPDEHGSDHCPIGVDIDL